MANLHISLIKRTKLYTQTLKMRNVNTHIHVKFNITLNVKIRFFLMRLITGYNYKCEYLNKYKAIHMQGIYLPLMNSYNSLP